MSEPRNTRERIKQVAMGLFNESGYDRTSLREIAERLDLTKAAVYYHFKTKDDIAASYFADFSDAVAELADWSYNSEANLQTRHEVLARYSRLLSSHQQTLRFMHRNQPALRHLPHAKDFKARITYLQRSLEPENATAIQRLRCMDAIISMHLAWFAEVDSAMDPDEFGAAALQISTELINANEE